MLIDQYDRLAPDTHDPATVAARISPFREDFAATTRRFVAALFGPGADPDLVERVADDMAAARPGPAVAALAHTWRHEPRFAAAVAALDAPVVTINRAEPPPDEASLARYGIATRTLAGVGHFPMLEDPDGFNRLLTEVLAGFATSSLDGGTRSAPSRIFGTDSR